MIGAICALGAVVSWAGGSSITKFLTAKIDTLSLSMLRLWFASLCLLAFVFLSGRGADFVHSPLLPLVYVMAAGVIGLAIGDTIYIRSLSLLDVSRASPIAQCSCPVFTMFVAVSLLREPFTWVTGLGTFLVVLGIYLIVTGKRPGASSVSGRISGKGVILALIAALSWTIAAVLLKKGVIGMDPFVANSIRIPSAAIAISVLAFTQRRRGTLQFRKYSSHSIALAATAGLIDYALAGVLLVIAIQLIGVGRAVLLSETSPLFILPFSVFILKEKLTRYVLTGIFICVAGISLVNM